MRYASDLPDFNDLVRALHVLQQQLAGQFLFKGGTSLSKGWGLIDRFSEDIDL